MHLAASIIAWIFVYFYRGTVELLLEDKKWKEMMRENDDSKLHTPLRNLIEKMPGKDHVHFYAYNLSHVSSF